MEQGKMSMVECRGPAPVLFRFCSGSARAEVLCVSQVLLTLWFCVCLRYKVTQVELFALLCRLADELLFRQISWIKKLPFFCELSIEDYTCLLSSTWQELILLSCFTIYSSQIFGELADVTAKYTPSDDELQR